MTQLLKALRRLEGKARAGASEPRPEDAVTGVERLVSEVARADDDWMERLSETSLAESRNEPAIVSSDSAPAEHVVSRPTLASTAIAERTVEASSSLAVTQATSVECSSQISSDDKTPDAVARTEALLPSLLVERPQAVEQDVDDAVIDALSDLREGLTTPISLGKTLDFPPSSRSDSEPCAPVDPLSKAVAAPRASEPTSATDRLGSMAGVAAASSIKTIEPTISAPAVALPSLRVADPAPSRAIGVDSKPFQAPTEFERCLLRNLGASVTGAPYRQLAAEIQSKWPPDLSLSVLLVGISPSAQIGETLAHVAVVLAEQDIGPILLIDATPSRTGLSARLGRRDTDGLAEVFSRRLPWRSLIVPTAMERLHLLPCGREAVTNCAAAGADFAVLANELKRYYRLALIDGGNTSQPLAQALGRYADMTYLLVQLGCTTVDDAQAASVKLRAAGSRLVGAIVAG